MFAKLYKVYKQVLIKNNFEWNFLYKTKKKQKNLSTVAADYINNLLIRRMTGFSLWLFTLSLCLIKQNTKQPV